MTDNHNAAVSGDVRGLVYGIAWVIAFGGSALAAIWSHTAPFWQVSTLMCAGAVGFMWLASWAFPGKARLPGMILTGMFCALALGLVLIPAYLAM